MDKPHDVILAEMDWVVEFLTEQRAAAAARGDDLTQWTGLPELVAEHKVYTDELHRALIDPGD